MRIQLRFALLEAAAMLASTACGSSTNRPTVNEPSSRATTSAAPIELEPKAMESDCPQPAPLPDASDRTACMKSCQGMDEAVPLGSSCISQRESCTTRCASKYDRR